MVKKTSKNVKHKKSGNKRPDKRTDKRNSGKIAHSKSSQNAQKTAYRQVRAEESLRIKSHEVLIYGAHACEHALLNSHRKIHRIYCLEDHDLLNNERLSAVLNDADRTQIVDRHFFRDHFPQDIVHQNIALVVEKTGGSSLDHYLKTYAEKLTDIIVVLDQVTDPHNIGAIMRSANVFGASAIVVQDRNSPDMNGLIAKTACGAVEYVEYIQATNISRAMEDLKEAGYWCLGLDERGEQSISDAVKQSGQKIALIMGAEGAGLRRLVNEACDLLVSIPVYGQVPCLNVSNAAAVALSDTAHILFPKS